MLPYRERNARRKSYTEQASGISNVMAHQVREHLLIIPDGSHHGRDADCLQAGIYAGMDIGRLNENEHIAAKAAGANFRRDARVRSTKQLVLF